MIIWHLKYSYKSSEILKNIICILVLWLVFHRTICGAIKCFLKVVNYKTYKNNFLVGLVFIQKAWDYIGW